MPKDLTPAQIEARRKRIEARARRPKRRVTLAEEVQIKQPSRNGRPSKKTPAIMDDIIAGVSSGRSIANVCANDPGMPDVRSVYRWLGDDDDFRLAYLRACSNRSLVYADTIGDIAQAVLAGKLDPNGARVAIDSYKWLATKLVPTIFGERQEVQVTHQHLHLHALRQLSEAAKVGQAAIAQRELELQAIEIGDTIGDSSDNDLQPIEIITPRADDVSV
ncbi:hypothetical protein UFOVP1552_51 [uncultured Caudovirales phage]|uniref:Terminase small subunit n=1 Tax=uncultured Caudovirales phage TaxID=2100421 RepID=A0A6J5PMA2_9CAUD|nr:hypothetical protein UFOVP933_53 [uncultured Caudovirales phage]CAB4177575.1 hypothetical protein UFOVP1014_16 [uncultured Caudovirales phage]CAB4202885.1 hypothetical protein UFOVP1368_44 [uncultured Caudovirales phage]CAB5229379.1 hypothetical protein UFOVP1552_51 [uncultured Caudovirales phage]